MQSSLRSMPAFAKVYGVELFYETLPELTRQGLLDALKGRLPDIASVPQQRDDGPWVFEHQGHPSSSPGQRPRCLIAVSRQTPNLQALDPVLKQSWTWPRAPEVLARCRGSLLVTDLKADKLHHLERLVLFQRVLLAMLTAYPCPAIHWQPTQQVIEPREFLAAVDAAGGLVFTPGPLNVRLFRIVAEATPDSDQGDILMDTLGLAALGLPDVQCHFAGLDSEAVSRVLYNTGIYLFERGDQIDDGHTVPGVQPDQKWHCRRERSLALPERVVIDVDPGPPHSARERR